MTKIEYGFGPGGQYGQTVTYDYGNGCQTKTFTPISNSSPGEVKYNWDAPYKDYGHDKRVARTIGEQRANESDLLNAIKNGEDWHAAADIAEAKTDSNPEVQIETYNQTYLFSIREALKKKDYDVAYDLAVHCSRKVDKGEKGFATLCLSVLYGYSDIYYFLIKKFKNPRAMWNNYNLLDWHDQGVEYFCDDAGYRLIKENLNKFNLKLHGRKSIYDSMFCCSIC